MKDTRWLVIRADGAVRVAKRPRLGPDEAAFKVIITWPEGWGKVQTYPIEITLPEPPTVEVEEDPAVPWLTEEDEDLTVDEDES